MPECRRAALPLLVTFVSLVAVPLLAGCAGLGLPRSGETAASELEQFAAFVADVHPEPFRFVSRDAFERIVEGEGERLRVLDFPSELDVGLAFRRLVASLRDSHMQTTLPLFQPEHGTELALLPLVVERVNDEVFVDASVDPLPIGTTIRAIDGIPVEHLLEELSSLAIRDGNNEVAQTRSLSREFVKLYHLAYGMRDTYAVVLRSPAGVDERRELHAVDRSRYESLSAARHSHAIHGDVSNPLPVLRTVDRQTAVLRLSTFGVADQVAYAAELESIVRELSGIRRLILDLRGNEGGYRTNGIALLNHLADTPYVQWQGMAVATRQIPERDLVRAAFGTSLEILAGFPQLRSDGLHVLTGDPLANRMQPEAPHLRPELLLFVDGRTNSAANEFVLALRTIRPDARLVGEEVGGACDQHNGELPITYTTPTFGVSVLMSIIRIQHVAVPGCTFGRGLMPDIPVTYDREHFIAARDPYDEAAASAW